MSYAPLYLSYSAQSMVFYSLTFCPDRHTGEILVMKLARRAGSASDKPARLLCLNLTRELYNWKAGECVRLRCTTDPMSQHCICVRHKSKYLFGFHLPRSPTISLLLSPDGAVIFCPDAVELFDII
jgi:hypothetical protein